MNQIRKTTMKYEAFKPFAAFAAENKLNIRDPIAVKEFGGKLPGAIHEATSSDIFLYGHRAEAMFEALVASLGHVKLLRQEDGVNCFARDEGLEIPDFRIITSEDRHLLVEVKNFHQGDSPLKSYQMKASYLEGLNRYSELCHCELFVVIFWVRWGLWSLIPGSGFQIEGETASIEMGDAMKMNHLSLLGDAQIATKMPLQIVLGIDPVRLQPNKTEGNVYQVRINVVDLYCAGKRIERKIEQNIAGYLMFYGKLDMTQTARISGTMIDGIVHEFRPHQCVDGQEFEIVGSLSSMFSRFYLQATTDVQDRELTKIYARFTPGHLGQLIPDGYKGDALPLWIFYQQNESASDTRIK